jgi:heavy metal efflux system protein
MIGRLTELALRHRPVTLALLVIGILYGVMAFNRLPVEAYPDVTNVQIQIITLFPGHAAEEVERLVTVPVESEMNGIPKRASMRSISLFGLSVVTIVFQDDADRAYVRSQAFEHLQNVTLPPGAQASLSPDATAVGEIYRYTIKAPANFSKVELKSIEDWVVERKIRTVPGVVDVVGFGGPTKQYQVQVDPMKLKSYNLTLAQVVQALSNGNRNAGGAYIEHGTQLYVVRGLGFVQSIEDIGKIAVDTRNGVPVRVRDIGTVTIGNRIRLGRVGKFTPAGADDDDVVQGIVLMRKGENPAEVVELVKAKVEEINRDILKPQRLEIVPHYDRSELIGRTLHTARGNMVEGVALVLVVLLLFLGLGNFRSALVVALAVPVSLLGAFALLDLRGIPANLISIGAIDFGIIVDSAVVVIENLLRLIEEQRGRRRPLGETVVQAVTEMGRPILFSKAILLTAFIPLYTLQRVEGRIFRPMALTLTFALVVGTIFAVCFVPALATVAIGAKHPPGHESWIVRVLTRIYRPFLAAMMRRRWAVYLATCVLIGSAGLCLSRLGSEFLPKLDEGALWVRVRFPQSMSPTEASNYTGRIRRILGSFPETRAVISQLGRPDDGTDVNGFDTVELYVDLIPRDRWTTAHDREALSNIMNARLAELPGLEVTFSQYIEDNVNEAVSGIKGELGIKIFGDDPERLQTLADAAARQLEGVPGAADVGVEQLRGQPQVQIEVNRDAIARYGLSVNDVQTVIEASLGGAVATQVLEGERSFDLAVRIQPRDVADVESIRAIPLLGSNGERITLATVADVMVNQGLGRIYREENERRIAIHLSVRNRDLGSMVAEARAKVDPFLRQNLPAGWHFEWTGAFENQQRAVRRLAVIVPLTLAIVFFLLFVAFDSAKLSWLILLNVPNSAAGGILALPLAGLSLSVSSLAGFVALFGISVQNSVILIERIRELRSGGMGLEEAVREGAISRIRPMVMTAMMALFGLLPLALSKAVGAETARPFAVVIIGGLITDTLLTVSVIPLLYPYFEPRKSEGGAFSSEPVTV